MKKAAIGIDIGGTNTVFGIIDQDGNVLGEQSISTQTQGGVEGFLEALAKAVKAKLKAMPGIEIVGIGVGAPNGNYYKGTIEYAPNLKWKGVIPFTDLLRKHFDYPVIVLTNDANAAGIGEMVYGGARGMKDFIMITLGTGLGSGIVVNGQMVYGHDGFAGELGHVVYDPNGRICGCGRHGCLEAYVSAPGIVKTVFELLAYNPVESLLRDVPYSKMDSRMIYEAAKKEDPIALEAFDITGEILGKVLADSVAHTSPEAFFLFGGLASAGDLIFEPTRKYFEESLLEVYKNKIKILPSELDGAHAAILGASALVWKEIEEAN